MGTPGRKPIPNKIKELTGSKYHNPNEPICNMPLVCPDNISEPGREIFVVLAAMLNDSGIANLLDSVSLMLLAENLGIVATCNAQLAKDGLCVTTPSGHKKVNPYFKMKRAAETLVMKMLIEFGLTPSSRARLSIAPKEIKDELEKFIGD